MKATEQYFPLVLFIMLYKVVLTFEFVDADHSKLNFKLNLRGSQTQRPHLFQGSMLFNKLHLQCAEDAPLDVQDMSGFLWMSEDLGDATAVRSKYKILSFKLFSESC